MAVGGDVIREAADPARGVQWDKKREGRTRNRSAVYDYVHEHCDRGCRATDGSSRSATAVFPIGDGRQCCNCGVG
jgi:hypothetical protein